MKRAGLLFKRIKNIILNAVYPPRCSGCGEVLTSGALCEKCKKSLVPIEAPVCHRCGASLRDHDALTCGKISAETVAAYYYGGIVKSLIIELKDHTRDGVFNEFFADVCDKISTEYSDVDFDTAVCVPSYEKKKYSSSAVIAERLADAYMLDFDENTLVKYRETKKQHMLNQEERLTNLADSIKVDENKAEKVRGKTILLCDDVKSTGATLDECAKALYSAGAKKVCCICIAVSDYVCNQDKLPL
ncbi:MAG: double zinc ribbon domain-containing protein [Oscillospiraceae bacterium]|nr:double zinc ribbon domain-containing protein [Oscillospiraceae bacterium]